jgi:hypothetical protein
MRRRRSCKSRRRVHRQCDAGGAWASAGADRRMPVSTTPAPRRARWGAGRGSSPRPRQTTETIGDADQHLMAIELAAAIAEIRVAIFETSGDIGVDGVFDAAAHEPPVTIFGCGPMCRPLVDRGAEPSIGVAAPRIDQGVVRHQVAGPRRQIDGALRVHEDGGPVRRPEEVVIDPKVETRLGADHEARGNTVVITKKCTTGNGVLRAIGGHIANPRSEGSGVVLCPASLNTNKWPVERLGIGI